MLNFIKQALLPFTKDMRTMRKEIEMDSKRLNDRLKEINERLRVINIKTTRLQKEEMFQAKKEQEELRQGLEKLTSLLNSMKDNKMSPLEVLNEVKQIEKVKDIAEVVYKKYATGEQSSIDINKMIESKIQQAKQMEEERKIRIKRNMEELAKESQKILQEKRRIEEEINRIMSKWEKEFKDIL